MIMILSKNEYLKIFIIDDVMFLCVSVAAACAYRRLFWHFDLNKFVIESGSPIA